MSASTMKGQVRIETKLSPEEFDKMNQGFIDGGWIGPGEDPGLGLQKLVRRFLAKQSTPAVSKAHRRIAELESVLDLAPGHTILEANAVDFIWGIIGDPTMMHGGWEFEDPAATEASIRRLVEKWKAEDGTQRNPWKSGK